MTEPTPVPVRKRARAPVLIYLAIATALVVVVAVLPRTGDQTPPPTVAEFAPQAAREIRESIADQSSNFGSGRGRCEPGQAGCGPDGRAVDERKPPPIHVPSVKQCFGDPPRQTQDPQSPPCVPYWKGKNGGATAKGVTANEITVALPSVAFEDPAEIRRLLLHFNARFQLYNRKIVFKVFPARGNLYSQPDPALELADAKDVDEKYQAFASLSTGGRYGSEHLYYDELARRGIISVAHRAGTKTSEDYLAKFAPYRWSVVPGIDTMQRHVGEFACNTLEGRASEYAGPGSVAPKRVFGLIHQRAKDGSAPDLDLLRNKLEACGAKPAEDVEDVESSDTSRTATNTMLKMVQAGVTTVICMCDVVDVREHLMRAATAEQYRPEWVVSSYIDNDVDNSFAQAPPDQGTHVIGVSFRNKWLPRANMPWFWAMKDAAPETDPPAGNGYPLAARYSSLLLLASGIQLAGPNLTPHTFEQGLHRARFPNPGAGGPPYYQARVGFENGRHTMIADATMFWYSRTERGTVEPNNVGAVCYVDQGKRYALDGWKRHNPAFFGDCRGG